MRNERRPNPATRRRLNRPSTSRPLRVIPVCGVVPARKDPLGNNAETTEHKRAHEELRESQERLRLSLEIAALGSYERDLVTNQVTLDANCRKIMGLPPDAPLDPQVAPRSVFADDRERVLSIVQRAFDPALQEVCAADFRIVRPDGEVRWVAGRGRVVFDHTVNPPKPLKFLGFLQDITDRKRTEEALSEKENRFRSFVEASSQVVWIMTPAGELPADLNPDWKAYTGQTDEQARGLGWQNAIHPEDRATITNAWLDAIQQRRLYEVQYRLRRHDGNWRQILARGVPVLDSHGSITEWIGASIDITERKQAEDALKESEERFRTLANNIVQLAWMADETGSAFWYNQRWLDYAGAADDAPTSLHLVVPRSPEREEEVVPREVSSPQPMQGWGWHNVIHPEHAPRVLEKIRHCFQTGEPWEDTFPLRARDGHYRWFLSQAIPIRGAEPSGNMSAHDRHGRVVRWFGTLTDVTAQREIEQALREARDDLARANADLDQKVQERTARLRETVAELEGFSYSITHDMRGPLRAMNAYAQVLETEFRTILSAHRLRGGAIPEVVPVRKDLGEQSRGGASPEGPLEYLRRIKVAAHRMDQLIQDSLNYSKLVREHLPLAPVDLGDLLRGMIETYPNLQPPEVEISVEFTELFVLGNESALTQCFSNLLGNAVKFVASGRKPRVKVWAETLNLKTETLNQVSAVRIWVEDNGIGIPAEGRDRIFGMFQRLHRVEDYPGTGIGLALVRKAVQRMRGRVGVDSRVGRGSRFWVELTPAHSASR